MSTCFYLHINGLHCSHALFINWMIYHAFFIDVLILGTGRTLVPPSPPLRKALLASGISTEVLSTVSGARSTAYPPSLFCIVSVLVSLTLSLLLMWGRGTHVIPSMYCKRKGVLFRPLSYPWCRNPDRNENKKLVECITVHPSHSTSTILVRLLFIYLLTVSFTMMHFNLVIFQHKPLPHSSFTPSIMVLRVS